MSQDIYPPTIQGDRFQDEVDAGNPVKIGGRARSITGSAVAAGDRIDAFFDTVGKLMVGTVSGTSSGSDVGSQATLFALGSTASAAPVGSALHVYDGAAWPRLRGDLLGLNVSRAAAAATATLSNVAASASSVTLLALNAARKGATIYNDSSAILYVKFGTTASTTSYTVQMAGGAYFELPFGYTGRIDGIWASATGDARITELT